MDVNPTSTASAPRPFGEIFGLWIKVLSMNEAFFAAEASRTSSKNTLIAVLIYAVFSTIIGILQGVTRGSVILKKLAPGTEQTGLFVSPVLILLAVLLLVASILGYYIYIGLLHLAVRARKGQGSYTTLAYLVSLFFIPLGMISSVVSLIPVAGSFLALVVGIYILFLTVRSLKVTYQLTTGKAWGSLIILVVIGAILSVCSIVVLALLGPALGTFH